MGNEYLNNKTFESIIKSFQELKRRKERNRMILEDKIVAYTRRVALYGDEADVSEYNTSAAEFAAATAEFTEVENQLTTAFYLLAENIANYTKFNSIAIEDAVQEGVIICFDKIDRFDPRKGKAFNYMTTCILNHFRHLYRTARNYTEFKHRYQQHIEDQLKSVLNTGRKKLNTNRNF